MSPGHHDIATVKHHGAFHRLIRCRLQIGDSDTHTETDDPNRWRITAAQRSNTIRQVAKNCIIIESAKAIHRGGIVVRLAMKQIRGD